MNQFWSKCERISYSMIFHTIIYNPNVTLRPSDKITTLDNFCPCFPFHLKYTWPRIMYNQRFNFLVLSCLSLGMKNVFYAWQCLLSTQLSLLWTLSMSRISTILWILTFLLLWMIFVLVYTYDWSVLLYISVFASWV